jgi:PrtD family type I secretion system ABC transporter
MTNAKQSVLKAVFRPYLPALASLIVFSFFSTLLNLVPPIFMMQLSERVMLSRNETTLIFLTIIALFLVAALTVLETIRTRTLARVSVAVDGQIGERVFDALNRRALRMAEPAKLQVLHDLNAFRDFVGGPVILQLLDLCWVPLILVVMFLMHPFIGLAMTVILALIVGLSVGNQWAVGDDIKRAQAASAEALEFARSVRQSAEATRPMGTLPALRRRWYRFHVDAIGWHHVAAWRSEMWTAALRFVRYSQLILLLVVGAMLYLNQQINAGAVFGVIYIAMRAVAPVAAVTSSWRAIWNFLLASDRLDQVLSSEGKNTTRMSLPRPRGAIVVSRVVLTPPNTETIVLGDVSFALQSGRILGVVGPSGAGKSSLAKLLVGAWHPRRGTVHLDEHDLAHWDEDRLGEHIGYVPQEIDLLPGTIAENIARFRDDQTLNPEAVLEAAELAGIEDVIRDLPDGYNTRVGADGHVFSGGQRQRLALARAVYGNPSLLVLDEPNSNLDAVGEQTLGRAMTLMKNRGATIVLVTHRMSMLAFCDDLLVMNSGTVHTFGPRDLVMNRLPTYRLSPASHLDAVAAR